MTFRHIITLASIAVFPIRAKGGVSPRMALGSMPTRPALLIRVEDTDGCFGWGEIWANFPPRGNLHKAHIIEDVVAPHLQGARYVEPREIGAFLRKQFSIYFLHAGQLEVFEHILAGIDTALWDLALRKAGRSFAEFMGISESSAQSYASSINAGDLERLIPHHASLGQTYFKLKIGFAEHGNRKIVERAARLCPGGSRIMVDSNQSWTLAKAKETLGKLEDLSPYFAEESLPANAPLADWDELASSTRIPLAGGENIYGIESFCAMANAGLRILQPDVAKWGGVTGALDLVCAMPRGTYLWPHFMGTAVGQVAALSISAVLGETSSCEVDVNENALRTELCGDIITVKNGRVNLPSEPGLVMPPIHDRLVTFMDSRASGPMAESPRNRLS
ncbi:MAG: mandelate racemase/muconate lactonizing enzyme family protein [Paracoccaceae bacterium]|nr:mandelate racemase/muconate lactonizing enzyme family protein [Paracoccaceae bacterium]